MSKFVKINTKTIYGNMTLRELNEYCRDHHNDCKSCRYSDYELGDLCCMFNGRPVSWEITKTYKEDFLKRYPTAILTDGEDPFPIACVFHIYGVVDKAGCLGADCRECWNTVMPEEE